MEVRDVILLNKIINVSEMRKLEYLFHASILTRLNRMFTQMPVLTTYLIEEAKLDILFLSPMIKIGVKH